MTRSILPLEIPSRSALASGESCEGAAQSLMVLFYRGVGDLPSGEARHLRPLPDE